MYARFILIMAFCLVDLHGALAGPPFVTDDPEPVDFRHWELYVASLQEHKQSGSSGTLPHIELNYGAMPNLQIHLISPYAFTHPEEKTTLSGYGDTEVGIKYRFLQETRNRPMLGVFPLVELPTGNSNRGLGSGHFQFFFPVWLQKNWGSWISYGGGGYNINPGTGNRNFWLLGWEIQKDLSRYLTLGGEVYGTTPTVDGGLGELDFNIGGQYNFDEVHHLLFSAGRSIKGVLDFTVYVAFQWTFGPR